MKNKSKDLIKVLQEFNEQLSKIIVKQKEILANLENLTKNNNF